MKIEFVSRANIKKMIKSGLIDKENTNIISVSDTFEEEIEMNNLLENYMGNVDNIITMSFADNEDDFQYYDAEQLFNFIKMKGYKKNYLVHCFAGISRSGAIAKFINEYYNASNWYLEDYKGHNRHVFNSLHKAAGTSLAAYYEELEKQDRKHGWED